MAAKVLTISPSPSSPASSNTADVYDVYDTMCETGTTVYELDVRQHPRHARMAGAGAKADRRPLDPPPIIRLRIRKPKHDKNGSNQQLKKNGGGAVETQSPASSAATQKIGDGFGQSAAEGAASTSSTKAEATAKGGDVSVDTTTPSDEDVVYVAPTLTHTLFCFASLVGADHDRELYQLSGSRSMHVTGSVVSSLFHLKDQSCFVFPDLSVRTEGRFRFKMSLFEILEDGVRFCTSIFTDPFQVYSSKRFPGMGQSTELSKAFAQQGLRLRIRRPGGGPRRDGDEDDGEEDDDEEEVIAQRRPGTSAHRNSLDDSNSSRRASAEIPWRKRPATAQEPGSLQNEAQPGIRRGQSKQGANPWGQQGSLMHPHAYGVAITLPPRTGSAVGPPIFPRAAYPPAAPHHPTSRPRSPTSANRSQPHLPAPHSQPQLRSSFTSSEIAFGITRPAPASAFYSPSEIAASNSHYYQAPGQARPPVSSPANPLGFAPPRPPPARDATSTAYRPSAEDPYGLRRPLAEVRMDRRPTSLGLSAPVTLPPLRGSPALHISQSRSSYSDSSTTASTPSSVPSSRPTSASHGATSASHSRSPEMTSASPRERGRALESEDVRLPKLRKMNHDATPDRNSSEKPHSPPFSPPPPRAADTHQTSPKSSKLSMLLGSGSKDPKTVESADEPLFF